MRTIGTVTRLQIQRGSLKRGEKPTRLYDPAPLLCVAALNVTPDGALGASPDGGDAWIVDVHHRGHPDTKNEDGQHGISLGFTSHYDAMRAHLAIGCRWDAPVKTSSRPAIGDSATRISPAASPSCHRTAANGCD